MAIFDRFGAAVREGLWTSRGKRRIGPSAVDSAISCQVAGRVSRETRERALTLRCRMPIVTEVLPVAYGRLSILRAYSVWNVQGPDSRQGINAKESRNQELKEPRTRTHGVREQETLNQ